MRPKANVDLIRLDESLDGGCRPLQQRAQLRCLFACQFRDVEAVAEWLDDERPNAKRSDAMLDDPEVTRVDAPARQV